MRRRAMASTSSTAMWCCVDCRSRMGGLLLREGRVTGFFIWAGEASADSASVAAAQEPGGAGAIIVGTSLRIHPAFLTMRRSSQRCRRVMGNGGGGEAGWAKELLGKVLRNRTYTGLEREESTQAMSANEVLKISISARTLSTPSLKPIDLISASQAGRGRIYFVDNRNDRRRE